MLHIGPFTSKMSKFEAAVLKLVSLKASQGSAKKLTVFFWVFLCVRAMRLTTVSF